MADYYLRHGDYPAYSAVPSGSGWPLDAIDGDGLGTDLAVPAVATIALAGVTAAAGNAVVIMGVTLTCVASGAAANQFNAASGATLATNLAAAINAATGTVNAGTSAATPQLRDMVYARVNPGLNTSVQIMTRPGSATLNHASNSNVAISSSGFGVAPTITQFAGGASGAWGYLWNSMGALFPSNKAVNTYGVAFVAAAARPLVGPVLTMDDQVWQRGSGVFINSPVAGATIAVTAMLNLVVDSGTVWPGSNGPLTFVSNCGSGSSSFQILASHSVAFPRPLVWGSVEKEKMVFLQLAAASNSGGIIVGTNSGSYNGFTVFNALFNEATSSTSSFIRLSMNAAAQVRLIGCRFVFNRNFFYPLTLANAAAELRFEAVDCVFEWTALAASPGALFSVGNPSATQTWKLLNCRAIGASPQVFSGSGATLNRVNLIGRNLAGFSLSTTLMGQLGSSIGPSEDAGVCLLQNVGDDRAMRLESIMAVVDWMPGQGYPVLNSTLPNGTPWSYRMLLSGAESAARYGGATELLTLTKLHEDADAVRTVRVEMLVPSANASSITEGCLTGMVSYTDTAGIARAERFSWPLLPRTNATPLSSSAASWALNSYGAHVARKLEMTTAYAVKQGTEVEVSLFQRAPMPAPLVEVFVDPDLVIA